NIKGDTAARWKRMFKRLMLTPLVRQCSAVLPCGTLGAAYFERYGADRSRMFFMPYEPDYDLITRLTSEEMAATRERFHLHKDRRRIVFSGRLIAIKRPDLLIDAFVRLASERAEWDLIVIGDGVMRKDLEESVPP